MTTVRLTPYEVLHAADAGCARNVSAMRDRRPLERGRVDLGFERHIVGAIGEYAVCRVLNIHWQPVVGKPDTEIGDVMGLQVKSTTNRNGPLIVRKHDPASFPYILAIVMQEQGCLAVNVVGWLGGEDAKVPEYWREEGGYVHRAAYFVPHDALLELDALPLVHA